MPHRRDEGRVRRRLVEREEVTAADATADSEVFSVRQTGILRQLTLEIIGSAGGPIWASVEVGTFGVSVSLTRGNVRHFSGTALGAHYGALIWHGELPVDSFWDDFVVSFENRTGTAEVLTLEWVIT